MLRTLAHILLGALLCAALLSTAVAAPASYNFVSVASPGDPAFTQLLGINNSDVIAGYYGDGTSIPNNGFTLTYPGLVYTPENVPSASQTQVIGINNTGWNDGFYVDAGGVTHGFTFNGTFNTVDAPGTSFNQLLGINNGLTAVGYSSLDPTGATLQRSYMESGGTFTYLDGFLPAGTLNNQAVGLNNAGIVVGFYQDATGTFHGYIFNGTSASTLDYAGGMGTQAFGINNHGEIVGDYTDASGTMHGFVYIGGTFYTVDDPAGVAGSTIINGVNDLGQLVGFYADANDNVIGFVATPVPEPGTLMLLGSGMLAGLGFLRRKIGR